MVKYYSPTNIDDLLVYVNALPSYGMFLFGGNNADLCSALTNSAVSSACRGIVQKMTANNYFDYFVFSVLGNAAYIGRHQNGSITSFRKITTT